MTSSRQMRRSGLSHANPPSTERDKIALKDDRLPSYDGVNLDLWEEPPLREPVPSFRDYKGLEPHGVLEHMAPLGHGPTPKAKARVKVHEPLRRTPQVRNGEPRTAREEVSTVEPVPPLSISSPSLRSEHMPPFVPSSTTNPFDGQDASSRIVPNIVPTLSSPTRPSVVNSPHAQASSALSHEKFRQIDAAVQSAVRRSDQLGNKPLSLALRKLHDEALYNPSVASLLDAVLSQTVNEQQIADFQVYIKAAKKQVKKSEAGRNMSTPSVSNSPATNLRNSASRQLDASKDTVEMTQPSSYPTTSSNHTPSKRSLNNLMTNGSPSKSDRPLKRSKRSLSISDNDSPLSDLNSDIEDHIEDYAPDKVESTLSTSTGNHIDPQLARVRPGAGPRMGSFTNRVPVELDTPEARIAARKRLARGFDGYKIGESNVRSPLIPTRQPSPPPTALQQRVQLPRRNGNSYRNRANDDTTSESSLSSFNESLAPPPGAGQRGITPQLGRPPKIIKKVARIKQSPLKKRNGVIAGLVPPTESEANQLGIGRHDDHVPETDRCSACSGNGSLVMCDGCPRGYHFTCCDPPLAPDTRAEQLPDRWYCWRCTMHETDDYQDDQPLGIWTELRKTIKYRNPTAFHLPRDVRDYFEGVITGEEGEYDELHNIKISKARSGYEEIPDNLKIKDKKDLAVLCSRCGGSSTGKREIVPCDYCSLCWHLDCLDPPLASAPNKKSTNGKPRQTWMCPNHIDHELINMKASAPTAGKRATMKSASVDPDLNARTFRTRKPKEAQITAIGLRRGFKTNGLIEIEEEQSEEESEIEREISGVIYKVPERGIKLDFIDRIKRANLESFAYKEKHAPQARGRRKSQHIQTAKSNASTAQKEQPALEERSLKDRKAALNLMQLAQKNAELNPDQVTNLIDTLTAEAPLEVEELWAESDRKVKKEAGRTVSAPRADEQEKKDLEALIALAQKRLGSLSS